MQKMSQNSRGGGGVKLGKEEKAKREGKRKEMKKKKKRKMKDGEG
jgi:hypothetical protein